jgi:hypothetical protein
MLKRLKIFLACNKMRSAQPKPNPSSSRFGGAVVQAPLSAVSAASVVVNDTQITLAEIQETLKRLDWRLRVLENSAKKISVDEIQNTLQGHAQQIKNCEKMVTRYEMRTGSIEKKLEEVEKKTASQ